MFFDKILSKKSVQMAKELKYIYDDGYISELIRNIQKNYTDFNKDGFYSSVFNREWDALELKQRMRHISVNLGEYLPFEYKKQIEILKKTYMFMSKEFYLPNMIFQDFVEVFGLDEFEISMGALEVFSVDSSSEFAIRAFILKYPKKTMIQMKLWAESKNEHIRRLAMEGCRPRLPWGVALDMFKKDPLDILEIIELLKYDKSEYVKKSVANTLNDISKDNPDIFKTILKRYIFDSNIDKKMLKHASRTLLKASDKDMLEMFGYKNPSHIKLIDFSLTKEVEFGGDVEFAFMLESVEYFGLLRIEYILYFLRQNGSYSKKVFHIKDGDFSVKSMKIVKKHPFKKITTRNYYKGVQKIAVAINGVEFVCDEFVLR